MITVYALGLLALSAIGYLTHEPVRRLPRALRGTRLHPPRR